MLPVVDTEPVMSPMGCQCTLRIEARRVHEFNHADSWEREEIFAVITDATGRDRVPASFPSRVARGLLPACGCWANEQTQIPYGPQPTVERREDGSLYPAWTQRPPTGMYGISVTCTLLPEPIVAEAAAALESVIDELKELDSADAA